jgi:hypothetical protein
MRQFTGVLEREIAVESVPAGRSIVAHVPLPPDVYRELRARAAVSQVTAAHLMADILARAVGK